MIDHKAHVREQIELIYGFNNSIVSLPIHKISNNFHEINIFVKNSNSGLCQNIDTSILLT